MDPRLSSTRSEYGNPMRPIINGTVQVDNVSSMLSGFNVQLQPQQQQPAQAQSPTGDVSSDEGPAPLRRNQACLQCRRRKLKCDATRPHCATCQRSHAHLTRTSPKTQHVLTCTYDDLPETEASTSQKKRQRKPTAGSAGRKRKNGENEDDEATEASKIREEKEALERKVAELQNQLLKTTGGQVKAGQPPLFWEQSGQTQLSTFGPQMPQPPVNPESPTPFLDLLSTAAAAQNPPRAIPWGAKLSPPIPAPAQNKPWWERTEEPSPFSTNSSVSGIPHPQQRTSSYSSSHPSGDGTPSIADPQITPWGLNLEEPSHLPIGGEWRPIETVATVLEDAMNMGLDDVNVGMAGDKGAAAGGSQFLLDLLWPNWPVRLPEPSIMSHLIDVFFDMVPGMHRIIHRERFMSRMLLPPSHGSFPHVALLHAICGVAAHFTAWVNTPAPKDRDDRTTTQCSADPDFAKSDFTTRHSTLASEEIFMAVKTGEKTFDVLRAQVVLHRALTYNAAWIEAWSVQGMTIRNMLPMGLGSRNSHSGYKPATLIDPKDDVEREERRGVLWTSVMNDIASSAMSGWGTSLAMDELRQPLPTGTAEWKVGLEMTENPQDLESLDLFINHPIVDSFVLNVKACILAGRVARFQRRWRDRKLRPNDDKLGMESAEFKQLDSAISCFLMSIPQELKNPLAKTCGSGKSGIDPDLLSAHIVPFAAAILLHECFADMEDPDDRSAIRVRHAAHAIFGLINLVASSSVDLASVLLPNIGCDAAHACGRSLLLCFRIALNNEEEELASSIYQELQVLIMTYQQIGERVYLGLKQAEMMEMMLNAALSPTYDTFSCHMPLQKHPRHSEGVLIEISSDSTPKDLGAFFVTILNIKRGYWRSRVPGSVGSVSAHLSSAGVTPESMSERGNSSNSTHITTPDDMEQFVIESFWTK